MFDESGFDWKKATLPLFVASVILTITQILSVTWCSVNGEFYGYFLVGKELHACAIDMPGDWLFRYGSAIFSGVGMITLLYDGIKAFRNWAETRSINLSRTIFVLSMIVVTGELELLANTYNRQQQYEGIKSYLFDSWFYVFPVALFLLIISALSISKKLELIFSLNKR
jgi:hypothetical protein